MNQRGAWHEIRSERKQRPMSRGLGGHGELYAENNWKPLEGQKQGVMRSAVFERFPQAFVWQMDCKGGKRLPGDQLWGYFGCVGESPVARTRVECGGDSH